ALAKHFPDLSESWMTIGWCLQDLDEARAEAAFRKAVELEPSCRSNFSLAQFLARRGQVDEALVLAKQAREFDQAMGEALLSEVYMYADRYGEAAAQIEALIAAQPEDLVDVFLYRDLAICYVSSGQATKARDLLLKGSEKLPGNPWFLEM